MLVSKCEKYALRGSGCSIIPGLRGVFFSTARCVVTPDEMAGLWRELSDWHPCPATINQLPAKPGSVF